MSRPRRTNKWSADVTAHSDALDLEPHVFSKEDPAEIAESLKRSAEFERPSQVGRVSIGHVDAEPLHQSGGSKPVAESKTDARKSKNEIARAVWPQGLSLSPGAHPRGPSP